MAQRTHRGPAAPSRCRPSQPVPLALWPVAQTTAQYQRKDTYHPDSARHPAKMVPELARRIIAEYSAPGDLVVDPMCGIGTTLFEAALAGRRAVGVEYEAAWARLAESNFDFALTAAQKRKVRVAVGDARNLARLLGRSAGSVDLICTSPPYLCDVATVDFEARDSGGSLAASLNYSENRSNIGHARGQRYVEAMSAVYGACGKVLRPGGILAVVTKNTRRQGACLDLAALTVRLATACGLDYFGHVVALHAAVRDSDLVGRASLFQLMQVRKARALGHPVHLTAHENVSVFRAPLSDPRVSQSRPAACPYPIHSPSGSNTKTESHTSGQNRKEPARAR